MRIALYGIGGLYNYGCEAIVRGTVAVIRKVAPDAQITYYSRRADEDRVKIMDLGIETVQLKRGYSIVARLLNRIGRKVNLPYRFGERGFRQITDASDVILSIGGDIYTIPKYMRSQKEYPYYKSLVQFGEHVLRKRKKLIVFGASIGPFGEYEKARRYYFNHLKKMNLIVARERRCMDYLKENAIEKNVCFMPDPAYWVELPKSDRLVPEYIGINFSPLSLQELYGDVSDGNLKRVASIIDSVAEKSGLPILLIPHVISPLHINDNDLIFMENVFQNLSPCTQRITSIREPNGFLEAKGLLRRCRVVVAARMHCAINAVSEGVPIIFLTYSEKAQGMAQYVYGDSRWQMPLEEIENGLADKIYELLQSEDKERNYLHSRMAEIRNEMMEGESIERIRRTLEYAGNMATR